MYLQPEVVELHLSMTSAMKEIQMAVLDLITATVQVRKVNRLLVIVYFCNHAHGHREMVA